MQLTIQDPISRYVKVTLDGVKQKDCIAIDTQQQWVKRYKHSNTNTFVNNLDDVETEVVYGDFELSWESLPPQSVLLDYCSKQLLMEE